MKLRHNLQTEKHFYWFHHLQPQVFYKSIFSSLIVFWLVRHPLSLIFIGPRKPSTKLWCTICSSWYPSDHLSFNSTPKIFKRNQTSLRSIPHLNVFASKILMKRLKPYLNWCHKKFSCKGHMKLSKQKAIYYMF